MAQSRGSLIGTIYDSSKGSKSAASALSSTSTGLILSQILKRWKSPASSQCYWSPCNSGLDTSPEWWIIDSTTAWKNTAACHISYHWLSTQAEYRNAWRLTTNYIVSFENTYRAAHKDKMGRRKSPWPES